ncbi:TIR domain-containing protein [Pustulibacterium marinum]|uniref:TIR domain-containing protein n=1 Tax=Pustulibacterium marinum TaxID=1224947 RepID=A0A1I7FUV3_9FLAO|nr:TIR domain-containing protein [Pustulibacterium marinum]SFU39938.1 TIR domain-containing protein [Pustulibacterium marinum]
MKVFLSWSGQTSHKVATILRDWIPSVIQSVVPYVSSEDIDKGTRWSTDIAKELEDSAFGILCVTKDNIDAPWLTFEAGALSKKLEKSYVSPFLFDIKRAEIDGPILQFQSTVFEKEDIKKLLKTINKACGDDKLSDERFEKSFEVWYPNLEKELTALKKKTKAEENPVEETPENFNQQMLEEILELSRINQRILRDPESILPPDYLRYALEKSKSNEKDNSLLREKEIIAQELNHLIYRLKELTFKYKELEKPIDEEFENNVHRLTSVIDHLEFINRKSNRLRR